MTPDDPRYTDPRFDSMGKPIGFAPFATCAGCGDDEVVEPKEVDGETFCESCYRDLPVCGDGEHRFTGEPAVEFNGFKFCSEEHAVPYREDEVYGALEETA